MNHLLSIQDLDRSGIERIITQLEDLPAYPERNRTLQHQLQMVLLLEHLASPEARQFLRDLAAGAADAHLTQAARRALDRLGETAKGDKR